MWCTTITYSPIKRGFLYLVAIMDWQSRKVLAWRLSTTIEPPFGVEAWEEALGWYGVPERFNTDQGSPFTAREFISVLKDRRINSSWMGKASGCTVFSLLRGEGDRELR